MSMSANQITQLMEALYTFRREEVIHEANATAHAHVHNIKVAEKFAELAIQAENIASPIEDYIIKLARKDSLFIKMGYVIEDNGQIKISKEWIKKRIKDEDDTDLEIAISVTNNAWWELP